MPPFSEAWLREYQSRRAAASAPPDCIRFTLSQPTLLLNVLLRMDWRARRKYQAAISAEIASLVPHVPGRRPYDRARVTIDRYSLQLPDHDGAVGGAKLLVDALLVRSARHPTGLGLIVDDDPAHLTLDVRSVRCGARKEQRTEVLIQNSTYSYSVS